MFHYSLSPLSRADQRGFTAIELMVVVSIVAILAALAAPSFQPLIERWRVRDATESLQSSLYFARSEALKRVGNVVVLRNATDGSCTSTGNTDWKCGWTIFHDANRNGVQNCVTEGTGECTLQQAGAFNGMELTVPGSDGRLLVDRFGTITNSGGAAASIEAIPKGKPISDVSAMKLCVVAGGNRINRIKGSETC